eukprot:3911038-Rhodomonas_salina.1
MRLPGYPWTEETFETFWILGYSSDTAALGRKQYAGTQVLWYPITKKNLCWCGSGHNQLRGASHPTPYPLGGPKHVLVPGYPRNNTAASPLWYPGSPGYPGTWGTRDFMKDKTYPAKEL